MNKEKIINIGFGLLIIVIAVVLCFLIYNEVYGGEYHYENTTCEIKVYENHNGYTMVIGFAGFIFSVISGGIGFYMVLFHILSIIMEVKSNERNNFSN